jgi:hypothetical protein
MPSTVIASNRLGRHLEYSAMLAAYISWPPLTLITWPVMNEE